VFAPDTDVAAAGGCVTDCLDCYQMASPESADAFQAVLRKLSFDLVPDLTRQSLQAPRLVSVRVSGCIAACSHRAHCSSIHLLQREGAAHHCSGHHGAVCCALCVLKEAQYVGWLTKPSPRSHGQRAKLVGRQMFLLLCVRVCSHSKQH
jgi:hypothetical protein